MTTPIGLLDIVRIASPCSVSWEGMTGDERTRHCAECNHNVYNLSAMTRAEAERFLENAEGRVCLRLYRRADGSVLTRDCPVGAQSERKRIYRRVSRAAATGLALISGVVALTSARLGPGGATQKDSIESVTREESDRGDRAGWSQGVPPPPPPSESDDYILGIPVFDDVEMEKALPPTPPVDEEKYTVTMGSIRSVDRGIEMARPLRLPEIVDEGTPGGSQDILPPEQSRSSTKEDLPDMR